jgi:DNA-binding response OmpR family regulator
MANKKCILAIDDDPDILESIKVVLEKNGFAMVTALSGKEGIEAARKNRPDLILCDMMMESIDSGAKVALEIKRSIIGVPIFLLSSIGNVTASNIEVDKLGFDGYFQKPVDPDSLISVVKDALK